MVILLKVFQKDFTCFPENEDEFNTKFVHPLKLTIRNGIFLRGEF